MMNNRIFSRNYLLMIFLSVPLTLAIFVITYSSYSSIESRNKLKKNIAQVASHNVLDKIDRNFYERFGDVQAFAYNKLAVKAVQKDTADEDLQKFINTMTTYYVLYDLMMVCDSKGRVIAVNTVDKTGKQLNTRFLLGLDVADEEWFKICMSAQGPEGGAWYSDFLMDPNVKAINNDNDFGWGMSFAAPIKDEQGNAIGVWYNFASWYEVTVKIRQQAEKELNKSGSGAILVITNKEGVVIDASDSALVVNRANLTTNALDENQPISFNKMRLQPEDYVYEWAEAEGAYTYKGDQWKSVVLMPKEQFGMASLFSKHMAGLYCIVLVFLGGAAYLAIRFSKRVTLSLNGLKEVVDNISQGDLTEAQIDSQDEIGQMAKSVNTLVVSLQQKVHFAECIGAGKLQEDYQPVSNKDVLGISLLNMRNSLAQVADADRKRNWVTEGLATFANLLRAGSHGQDLYDQVILNLVRYTGANQGALFVLDTETSETPMLELVACYAYERKKFLHKRFELGEGLAGQAVLEKQYIYLTSLPQSYVHISSGLGDAQPNCALIMPLMVNEEVLGVVELAFFHEIPTYYIDFMHKVGENIASVISVTKVNEVTKKLLENAQQMTETMRAQEEEMRQNMEELQATQEEMQRKTHELEMKLQEREGSH